MAQRAGELGEGDGATDDLPSWCKEVEDASELAALLVRYGQGWLGAINPLVVPRGDPLRPRAIAWLQRRRRVGVEYDALWWAQLRDLGGTAHGAGQRDGRGEPGGTAAW